MNGILDQRFGRRGVLSQPDLTRPVIRPPQTPAYSVGQTFAPAGALPVSMGPGALAPQQEAPQPEIDERRVNPLFLEAYRSSPSVAIQNLAPSLNANAEMRQMFLDRMMLGRPPSEEEYSPGMSALAGALSGVSSTGNALGAIGGALIGYAQEKESQRSDMSKYQEMQAKMAYDLLKDQRDYSFQVGKEAREATQADKRLEFEGGRLTRDLLSDQRRALESDRSFYADETERQRKARLEGEEQSWKREDRGYQQAERRAVGYAPRNPYLDWDQLSGGSVEMAKEAKRNQSSIYQEASKNYRTQLTGKGEVTPILEKLEGLLRPGDEKGVGQGEAYKRLGDNAVSSYLTKLGAKISKNDPVNYVQSAIIDLGRLAHGAGTGVWTDADQKRAEEAISGAGSRDVMYQRVKEKLDYIRSMEQEQRDLDDYHLLTGGGATGFDNFRDEVRSFRSQLPEGTKVDTRRFFQARSSIPPDAQNVRPFMDADGKPDPNHIIYDDPNKDGDDAIQIVPFRWGR